MYILEIEFHFIRVSCVGVGDLWGRDIITVWQNSKICIILSGKISMAKKSAT